MNLKSCSKFLQQHQFAANILISGLLLSVTALVQALPGDSQQPINIQSDRASQKSTAEGETTEYFGNVVMTQGSLKISGEHIVILSKNHKVQSIIADGKPAHFEQQSNPAKAPIKANAEQLDYQLKTDTVILTSNAEIDQGGNLVSGDRIEYNIASEQVRAQGAADESTRVKMVLIPETANDSNTAKSTEQNQSEPSAPIQ